MPKAPSKKATAPKSTKSAKTKPAKAKADGLTANETAILQALANGKELTRKELAIKASVKPTAKLMGASTRDKGGVQGGGLEGKGLVRATQYEGSRQLTYAITAKGKKAVAKV